MLNKIIQWSLNNRLLVIVGAVALLVYGGLVAFRSPVDVFPDLTAPTVTSRTDWRRKRSSRWSRCRSNRR
jgi:Cu/Ag efflux pump CusA